MNQTHKSPLSLAVSQLFEIGCKYKLLYPDFQYANVGFVQLGNETAKLCQSYEGVLDERQLSILIEQRTNMMASVMLGNSTFEISY